MGASVLNGEPARPTQNWPGEGAVSCRGEKRRVCSWMQVEVGAVEASSRGQKWSDSSVTGSPGWYNSLGVSMEAVRTGDV